MRLTPQAGQVDLAIKEWSWAQHPPSTLSPFREWTRLDGVLHRPHFKRGAVIYSPGDPSDHVFLLKAGKVKIVRVGPDDKRLIVQLVGPGEIFGELALLGETHRENAAEVLEEAALWMIPRKTLLEWLRPRPEAWQTLAAVLGKRLKTVESAFEGLLFLEVEQRLVRFLLRLAEQYGEPAEDGVNLKIELSQRELAHLIGSTRETTSSILNRLCKKGLLRIRRRRLAISSMADLSALAAKTFPPKLPPKAEEAAVAAARPAGAESR